MQLNIFERIVLIDMLPKEGHYADLKALRVAREVLSLTEEEVKEVGYFEQDGKAFFDIQKGTTLYKEFPISEWVTDTVQSILAKKDKEGKLEEKCVTLFDKFVIANE
jgi:hypothetical protein